MLREAVLARNAPGAGIALERLLSLAPGHERASDAGTLIAVLEAPAPEGPARESNGFTPWSGNGARPRCACSGPATAGISWRRCGAASAGRSARGPSIPSIPNATRVIPRLPDNPWVIAGNRVGGRLANLNALWVVVRRRAGLEDVRIHDLRHSFVSRALALGESLTMIGKLLGHRQVQTTVRYAHLAGVGKDFSRESGREHRRRHGETATLRRHMNRVGVFAAVPVAGVLGRSEESKSQESPRSGTGQSNATSFLRREFTW